METRWEPMTIKISFKKNIQETLIEGKSDRRYGKDKNTPHDAEKDEKAKAKRDRRHKDKQDLKQKLKRERKISARTYRLTY